jgi:hypothetical protein
MSRPRLDRRLVLLRGKRHGAFDRDQYYLEHADRARVARRTRALLRRMQPVVLVTPRWSDPERFLDDLALDLSLGTPQVECRTLSLVPLIGRTPYQAWTWLASAISEFGGLPMEGPASQVVSRKGFRHVLEGLLDRAEFGGRRCLMIHGLEHLHVDALRDLIAGFSEHAERRREAPRFNLLLAGSIDAPHFEFAGIERLVLDDFGEEEAIVELVERLGPSDLPRLRALVAAVGGVPALLDRIAAQAEARVSDVIADRRALWTVLEGVAAEVRRAVEIVASDDSLLARIDELARAGKLPEDRVRDTALVRAGLARTRGAGARTRKSMLRSPAFADLA